jgi:hypothetical protein
MNEHNLRKNVLFTLSGYLIYLIILAFFEKHNNYDLSQCNNSSSNNSSNSSNNNFTNMTNMTNMTNICQCKNIIYQIDMFNYITIIYGLLSCIFLLIVFGYIYHKQKIINLSIVVIIIYIFLVEVTGLPILIITIMKDCYDRIYDKHNLYLIGFVSHIVIVSIFALVMFMERTRLESFFVNRPNRHINQDMESEELINDNKPPPYYR